MVGGLADWFAVVALFRRPFGLPIPHTGLIAAKKRKLVTALGTFVAGEFLTEDLLREKVSADSIWPRIGEWLSDSNNQQQAVARVIDLATRFVPRPNRGGRGRGSPSLLAVLTNIPYSAALGDAVSAAVKSGEHRVLVDLIVSHSHEWLSANESTVVDIIVERVPWFLPRKATARRLPGSSGVLR